MHRVFLGLGSNMDDRLSLLRTAVKKLPGVIAVSPLYETDPVGGPSGQPDYLNCVVELQTDLDARQILNLANALESEANRVRTVANGPRTLDIDILLFDDETIDEPDLVVPHPRMWERRFVVQPLTDLAPDLIPAEKADVATGEVRLFKQYWVSPKD
jgi:2-amino-4-hydroxy-6-hydroxymethyldihydropteridine diphosphokinase